MSLVSTMSRANRGPDCSAAIRTGADRSGFRSIFSPSSRCDICIPTLAKTSRLNCRRDQAGRQASSKWPKSSSADCSDCSCGTQTAGDQRSDQIPASSATGRGAISCSSTSTFTAIPARALAPRIRPAGRLSPARWWLIGVCEMIVTPADGAIFQFEHPRRPRVGTHNAGARLRCDLPQAGARNIPP